MNDRRIKPKASKYQPKPEAEHKKEKKKKQPLKDKLPTVLESILSPYNEFGSKCNFF